MVPFIGGGLAHAELTLLLPNPRSSSTGSRVGGSGSGDV